MANVRSMQRSFAGGEVSPEMGGHIDDSKYQSGASRLRNLIVRPQGPATRRPGFRFVREVKDSTKRTRLIPFSISPTESLIIEMGAGYFRFHTDAATVLISPAPAAHRASSTIVSFSGATDAFTTSAAHGLVTNDPVRFTTSGALPTGVTINRTYYVIFVSATEFQVSETVSGAFVPLSGLMVGVNLVHYAYVQGDLVTWSGGSPGVYYCSQSYPNTVTPPTTSHWYAQPAGGIYEIPNAFVESNLPNVGYAQSWDVMTLVHPDHAKSELVRTSANRWTLTPITLGAKIDTPAMNPVTSTRGATLTIGNFVAYSPVQIQTTTNHNLVVGDPVYIFDVVGATGVPDGLYVVYFVPALNEVLIRAVVNGEPIVAGGVYNPNSARMQYASLHSFASNSYKVTAIGTGGEESVASSAATVANNLFVAGAYNTVNWGAVSAAVRYRVYKLQSGIYGFIGQSETTSFKDDNIDPDLSITPPLFDASLDASNQPSAVTYYEQRRVFAAPEALPQDVWMTRTGTDSDLSYHLPLLDTDRISFSIAATEASIIKHLVPLGQLMLLTSAAEFRLTPVNSDAITPTSVSVRPQSYIGSSEVRPVVVNNAIVFCAARGGHVRELGYRQEANGFLTGDLSLRAAHLFDGQEIMDLAYSKAPYPILWMPSTSGLLLGLTYVPEEQVGAWHPQETDGLFESCATAIEGRQDALYAVVKRTIGGATKRYIERMEPLGVTAIEDSFYVDSGLTYDGAPATVISGLTHLNGKTVAILADGVEQATQVVTGGAITLATAASVVQVGLPFVSQITTLPLALQIQGFGQGRRKNVNHAWINVIDSTEFEVGPAEGTLVPAATAFDGIDSGEIPVMQPGKWNDGGQITIRQTAPLPLTVVSYTLEVAIGS